ncbi:hypothetical protein [Streptomyces sp. NPDC056061]|uniref:hypothetical protein n=1 Tax=Streptomyces sp. NPDC056061 TaxID=3345700 RepID=UPI0035D73419
MSGIWRQVLAAYTTDRYEGRDREQLLALGAAELACARTAGGRTVAAEDVQRIAREEFGLVLDERMARAALAQRRTRRTAG